MDVYLRHTVYTKASVETLDHARQLSGSVARELENSVNIMGGSVVFVEMDRPKDWEIRSQLPSPETMTSGQAQNGSGLVYDDFTGRMVQASKSEIDHAVTAIQNRLMQEGEVFLNDFYELIGIPEVQAGANVGWTGADKIEIKWGPIVVSDQAAHAFWFTTIPRVR